MPPDQPVSSLNQYARVYVLAAGAFQKADQPSALGAVRLWWRMLRSGILNPNINALLSRVRHTNRLVIADRGFPFWPALETIDIALVDDVPTVLQVLHAVTSTCSFGPVWMAEEFRLQNPRAVQDSFAEVLSGRAVTYEPHSTFKGLVLGAIGLIRTGDTTPYANIILESA